MPWGCPKDFSLPLAPLINITSNANNLEEKCLDRRLSLLGRNSMLIQKGSAGMHSASSGSSWFGWSHSSHNLQEVLLSWEETLLLEALSQLLFRTNTGRAPGCITPHCRVTYISPPCIQLNPCINYYVPVRKEWCFGLMNACFYYSVWIFLSVRGVGVRNGLNFHLYLRPHKD